ncbi:uncharacterized protein LOC119983706 [Tripterygium wilfordii]|uniref:uncharacterized protein LOC119983706 n=1 Tax=Tripterygium wilfordii TaxID=458696 RepID=UPI0018F817A4|nr:uncharacterized protein LOC119983706 [Tripterygium wilfordii]
MTAVAAKRSVWPPEQRPITTCRHRLLILSQIHHEAMSIHLTKFTDPTDFGVDLATRPHQWTPLREEHLAQPFVDRNDHRKTETHIEVKRWVFNQEEVNNEGCEW